MGWARLYPLVFRELPYEQQFGKYETIRVDCERNNKDPRPESYRPDPSSITVIKASIPTADNWAQRSRLVMPFLQDSMEEVRHRQEMDGTSLAIIRPKSIDDISVTATDREWTPKQRAKMEQLRLFGPDLKPLPKLPYEFRYKFSCDDVRCRGHECLIIDWEVGALYWRVLNSSGGDEDAAVSAVKRKFLGEMCGPKRDPSFFVGNMQQHPKSWLVLGVFWPKGEARVQHAFDL